MSSLFCNFYCPVYAEAFDGPIPVHRVLLIVYTIDQMYFGYGTCQFVKNCRRFTDHVSPYSGPDVISNPDDDP
jgi:hypothetical protein